MANDRNRDKLDKLVEIEITNMFEQILDYAQVACPTNDTYKVLRSKILRVGNNCIRNIKKKLDFYEVKYNAKSEDIVEVNPQQ
jgi:hypothetical protein